MLLSWRIDIADTKPTPIPARTASFTPSTPAISSATRIGAPARAERALDHLPHARAGFAQHERVLGEFGERHFVPWTPSHRRGLPRADARAA